MRIGHVLLNERTTIIANKDFHYGGAEQAVTSLGSGDMLEILHVKCIFDACWRSQITFGGEKIFLPFEGRPLASSRESMPLTIRDDSR